MLSCTKGGTALGEIGELCIISCITIQVFCFTQRHCTEIGGEWIVNWYFQVFLRIMCNFLYYNPVFCFTQRHCTVCHLVWEISERIQFQRGFLAISTKLCLHVYNFNVLRYGISTQFRRSGNFDVLGNYILSQFRRFNNFDVWYFLNVWQFQRFTISTGARSAPAKKLHTISTS